MVKHTQIIRGQQSTNCLSVSNHSVELEPKELKLTLSEIPVRENSMNKKCPFENFQKKLPKKFM